MEATDNASEGTVLESLGALRRLAPEESSVSQAALGRAREMEMENISKRRQKPAERQTEIPQKKDSANGDEEKWGSEGRYMTHAKENLSTPRPSVEYAGVDRCPPLSDPLECNEVCGRDGTRPSSSHRRSDTRSFGWLD